MQSYIHWFLALDELLLEYRPLWHIRPFTERSNPWAERWPQLTDWLNAVPSPEIHALEADPARLYAALDPMLPVASELARLCRVDAAPCRRATEVPPQLSYHVPGRKWQQIEAFVQALPATGLPLLEWCAGKGHLGRLAGNLLQQPVLSLELEPALCAEGEDLARRQGLEQRFLALDVLSDAAESHVRNRQVLALHACGDLHLRLLRLVARQGVPALHLSPCCYHRIASEQYQPLSQTAQASRLRLDRTDCSRAVQETVTAGQRVRRLQQRESGWRLGFDLLQRELRQRDEYLPVPPVPVARLNGAFADFCRWAAERKQLELPAGLDFDRYERAGMARLDQVRRLELVAHLFRRPLELWLVLDRVLFLQEQGYRVELAQFCERRLTPRNLLIQAFKTGNQPPQSSSP